MLTYEVRSSGAWITLNRPEKLNAMTRSFWGELKQAVARADADGDVRALVFSGAGRCFSVGGDIEGFAELRDDAARRAYTEEAIDALLAVEEVRKPTIAAVHGHALGGGCELSMACDVVVADDTATFGTPESAIGLIPGLGILRGRANVNLHWMKYLIFTGFSLDAGEARLAGLVQKVVPEREHLQTAELWVSRIAERSPTAIAHAKAFLGQDVRDRFAEAVDVVTALQGGPDLQEGVAAFTERRLPRFGLL